MTTHRGKSHNELGNKIIIIANIIQKKHTAARNLKYQQQKKNQELIALSEKKKECGQMVPSAHYCTRQRTSVLAWLIYTITGNKKKDQYNQRN